MTHQEKQIFVLTCLFVVLRIALTEKCPSQEDVAPCVCESRYMEIKCHGISDEELARVARNLRGTKFDTLTILESKLGIIPHDVFKGDIFKVFKIQKSSLTSLTDKGESFVGVENHLEELRIFSCDFKGDWDWTVLRNLKKLTHLAIHDTLHLETIGTDSMKVSVPSVTHFTFSRINISFVDHAFDSYKNIQRLDVSGNKIENVMRTMLPNPAVELKALDISSNLIRQLPEDIFTNMPNLKFLYLLYNNILVLDRKTFSPVWGQLITFSSTGNEHNCDCRMSWIAWARSPFGISGKCAWPPRLSGKDLENLKSRDFDQCKPM